MKVHRRFGRPMAITVAVVVGILIGLIGSLPVLGVTPAAVYCLANSGAYAPPEPRDFESDFYGYTYRGNTGDLIDREVYLFGAFEEGVLNLMEDVLERTAEGRTTVAVDVGANVGHHTMFLSRHADRVIAVEPFPPILEKLRANLQRNGIANVEVHAVGYSDERARLPYHPPPDRNQGMGSFASDMGGSATETVDLPLVPGDEDLASLERVDLLKVDIEGFEKPALHGLRHVLERDRPAVVFEMNVNNEAGFHSLPEIESTFPEGYGFYRIRRVGRREWMASEVWRGIARRYLGTDLPAFVACDPYDGRYELLPLADPLIEHSSENVLAYPAPAHIVNGSIR